MLRAADRGDRVAKWRAMASAMLDKSKRGLLGTAGKFAAAGLVLGAGALGFKWMAERKKKREEALRATVEELREALTIQLRGVEKRLEENLQTQRALAEQIGVLRVGAEKNAVNLADVETTRGRIRDSYEQELRKVEERVDEIALEASTRIDRVSDDLRCKTREAGRRFATLDETIGSVESRIDALERGEKESGGRSFEDTAFCEVRRNITALASMQREIGRRTEAHESSSEQHKADVESISRGLMGLCDAMDVLFSNVKDKHAEADSRIARVEEGHKGNVTRVERTLETTQTTLAELQTRYAENALLEARVLRALGALGGEGDVRVGFGASAPLALTLSRALSAVRPLERPMVARKIADVLLARGELEGHQTALPPGERRTNDLYTT